MVRDGRHRIRVRIAGPRSGTSALQPIPDGVGCCSVGTPTWVERYRGRECAHTIEVGERRDGASPEKATDSNVRGVGWTTAAPTPGDCVVEPTFHGSIQQGQKPPAGGAFRQHAQKSGTMTVNATEVASDTRVSAERESTDKPTASAVGS